MINLIITLFLVISSIWPTSEILGSTDETQTYLVTRVVDGDTVKVSINGKESSVRLLGIDTPELKGSTADSECFAQESKTELSRLIEGQKVFLQPDTIQANTDKYNRLLRYIYLEDININAYMVAEGFARVYDRVDSDQLEYFQILEMSAQLEHKGIWQACSTH